MGGLGTRARVLVLLVALLLTVALAPFAGRLSSAAQETWSPTITVVLSSNPGDSAEVGAKLTLSASIYCTPFEGPWYEVDGQVTFRVSGAHPGIAGPISTTSGSPATYSYTGAQPGDDTITAVGVADDGDCQGEASDALLFTWTAPPPPPPATLEVQLTPAEGTSLVGESLTETVTVTRHGQPVADANVSFLVSGAGADDVSRSALTQSSGQATFTYTRHAPVVDDLTVTVSANDGQWTGTASGRRIWRASTLRLQLAPDGTSSPANSTFLATATVTADGNAVAGAKVTFGAALQGAADLSGSAATDPAGRAPFPLTRSITGVDRISATVTVAGQTLRDQISHTWLPGNGLRVVLAPRGATTLTDSSFTVTATVTERGRAVAGSTVRLRARLAGAPDAVTTVTTDANGLASFTYSRDKAGTETVTATVTQGGRTATAATLHFWRNARGLKIELVPAGTSSQVNTPFTATATVTDQGKAVPDAQVRFRALQSRAPTVTRTATTGRSGTAAITYSRGLAGTDIVTAATTVRGRNGQASITHLWRTAAVNVENADLRLESTSSPPGGDVFASGRGCRPGSPVVLLLGSTRIGSAVAGADGRYRVLLHLPPVPMGRYTIGAICGPRATEVALDVVGVTSATGTAGAAAATTAAVFSFFILLGLQLVRGTDASSPLAPDI